MNNFYTYTEIALRRQRHVRWTYSGKSRNVHIPRSQFSFWASIVHAFQHSKLWWVLFSFVDWFGLASVHTGDGVVASKLQNDTQD